VEDYLRSSHQSDAVDQRQIHADYFLHGQYGRILGKFLQVFPREKINIVFLEDLEQRPTQIMQELFELLGVEKTFQSDCFENVYNSGRKTIPQKVFQLLQTALQMARKLTGIRTPVETLLPRQYRSAFRAMCVKLDSAPTNGSEDYEIHPRVREQLRDYFRSDVCALEEQFDLTVPWQEFKHEAHQQAA
jgi:hypothetical protein